MSTNNKSLDQWRKKQQKNKTERDEGLSNYVFGKLQPQAVPLEQAVLGALMLDKESIYLALELSEKSFYANVNKVIFKAILSLFEEKKPIDMLTVPEKLKELGELDTIGGPYYIVELTSRVASSANIEAHIAVLRQKEIRRDLISVASEMLEKAYDDTEDVFDILDEIDVNFLSIKEGLKGGVTESNSTIAKRFIEKIEKNSKQDGALAGERLMGIDELDEKLNGVEETDFILVPGRPSMGKSSIINTAALNAVKKNIPIAVWSFEMPNEQTFGRIVSADAKINGTRMKAGQMNDHEWQNFYVSTDKVINSPVIIKDDICNIHEFRAQVISLKRKHGIKAVFVDRVELFRKTDPNMGDTAHVSQVSPMLRLLANELKIPIIAISQLSRAVETRGGAKRPMLSDIRNSGNLEQDAVKVAFVYRAEYYNILEDDLGNSLKGKAEIIVAKNNNGPTGTVLLDFKGSYTLFSSPEEDEFNYDPLIKVDERLQDEDMPF